MSPPTARKVGTKNERDAARTPRPCEVVALRRETQLQKRLTLREGNKKWPKILFSEDHEYIRIDGNIGTSHSELRAESAGRRGLCRAAQNRRESDQGRAGRRGRIREIGERALFPRYGESRRDQQRPCEDPALVNQDPLARPGY